VRKYKKSFTLVELIMAIFLITLLAGISVPAVYHFQRQASLKTAANEIKSTILQAKGLAMSPRVNQTADQKMTAVANYVFACTQPIDAPGMYWIGEQEIHGSSVYVGGAKSVLPDNIKFSDLACNFPMSGIFFQVSKHGEITSPTVFPISIQIEDIKQPSETATISVSKEGNVTVNYSGRFF